jgi:hypothetical protein
VKDALEELTQQAQKYAAELKKDPDAYTQADEDLLGEIARHKADRDRSL